MKGVLVFLTILFSSIFSLNAEQIKPIQHAEIIGDDCIYVSTQVYNKVEIDEQFCTKVEVNDKLTNFYTKTEVYNINETYNTQQLYTKDEINELISKIRPSVGIVTNRYPLFCIELNTDIQNLTITTNTDGYVINIVSDADDKYSMSDWNAFELKASTNNFMIGSDSHVPAQSATLIVTDSGTNIIQKAVNVPGMPEGGRILFWACSEQFGENPDRQGMRKFTTDHYNSSYVQHDERTWTYFDSITQLENQHPNRVIVMLDPTKFKHTADNSWCHSKNEELVWSYVRISNSTTEKDDNGNTVWRPIQPMKWYSQLPNWAYTNNEVRVVTKEEYFKFK